MIYLIGTNHELQHTAAPKRASSEFVDDARRKFMAFLSEAASRVQARSIGEEFALDLLSALNAESLCQKVAEQLGISHIFCEPELAQRCELGIPIGGTEAPSVEETDAIREQFWLDQLDQQGREPILFVCGADHVVSFQKRLRDAGMHAEILADYWGGELYGRHDRSGPAA